VQRFRQRDVALSGKSSVLISLRMPLTDHRLQSILIAIVLLGPITTSSMLLAQDSYYETEDVTASDFPEPPEFGDDVEFDESVPRQLHRPQPRDRLKLLTAAERAPFRLSTSFAPEQSVRDSADMLSAYSLAAQGGFPLRFHDNGVLLGTTSLKSTRLSTDAVLPQSGTAIPDELWDIRVGMLTTRDLNNGWKVGGMLNFGSASDQPFESFDVLTLTSLGFVSVPARNQDSWNFSLFYSPTSQIRFPIPAVAYVWRPNDQLEAQIGLPASLTYAPNDSFSFRARYTPVTDVLVEARQMLSQDWSLFGRYQIVTDTYFLADRTDRAARFFQFEHQLSAGLSRQLPNGFSLDLSAGYLFDRRLFQSEDFDLDSNDLIEIGSGIAYTLQLIWTL
jgi:hypothetical protein